MIRETKGRSTTVGRRASRDRTCGTCASNIRRGDVYLFHTLFPRNDIWDNDAPITLDECSNCATACGRGHLVEARMKSRNGGAQGVRLPTRCLESEVGIPQSVLDRLDIADCWEWIGGKANGYGYVSIGGRHSGVHRVVWALLVGPIPDGLQIDHRCKNRACANPDHLEVVTQQENIARGGKVKKRPFCPEGHPYDVFIERRGGIERRCSICEKRKRKQRTERDSARRSGAA